MKALVAGFGLSGRSAYDYLKSKNIEVSFASAEDINEGNNFADKHYLDRLFYGLSFIVASPGIPKYSPLLVEARKRKVPVIGELELGTRDLNNDIIAITGTNGKTTTVSLIHFLLRNFRQKIFLAGNIGVPVTSLAKNINKDDILILEVSSFQLETINKFHSHIAAILNISEDHLNYHKTMNAYIKAKKNIAKNQTKNDYLLINADCELLMKNIPKTKAKIYYFSTEKKVCGCYVKRGCIYFNDNLSEKKLASLKGIRLIGKHNVSNILCAVLAVFLETNCCDLFDDISNFAGVPHRIEYVKTINGISFFNDSKATNISSTLVALSSFNCGINLILGGSDKGYNFDDLFAKIPRKVKNIAIFGQTKRKIAESAKKFNFKNIEICDSLKSCTHSLFEKSKQGDVVLLSPACASFDCFANFEERGAVFKKIVEEISIYENALASGETKTKI